MAIIKQLFLPMLLALMVFPIVARADSYAPYEFEVLQGLTQSADIVLTATIESVTVGQRGDVYQETTDTKVQCSVRAVYVGPKILKQQTITVVFEAADQPIDRPSDSPVLLILKREGDNYRLCFFHTYGVFRLEGGYVQVWFEGKPIDSYYKLKEILARIENYSKARIEMTTEVVDSLSLADGYLPVKFSFRNTGKVPVLLLPPSYCFDSFAIKRVVSERVDPGGGLVGEIERTRWESVDHWDFLAASEPISELKPGAERSFSYRIPFSALRIATSGNYCANFNYHPYQLSKWATRANLSEKQKRRRWLGVPKPVVSIISIKN